MTEEKALQILEQFLAETQDHPHHRQASNAFRYIVNWYVHA